MANIWKSIKSELNFFRVHVLFFTFTPLIFAAVFYAANGQFHISFIDSLFNCVSALLVCGLASIDLSQLTGFQQALMFVQACIGNPVVVSWVMVYIRRRYFAKRFEHIVEAEIAKRKALIEEGGSRPNGALRRLSRAFTRRNTTLSVVAESEDETRPKHERSRVPFFSKGTLRKLRPDMIHRMDDAPKLVDPNGWITDEPQSIPSSHATPGRTPIRPSTPEANQTGAILQNGSRRMSGTSASLQQEPPEEVQVRRPDAERTDSNPTLLRTATAQPGTSRGIPFGRNLTVEFKTPDRDGRGRRWSSGEASPNGVDYLRSRSETGSRRYSQSGDAIVHDDRHVFPGAGHPMNYRTNTMHTMHTHRTTRTENTALTRDFGGFPGPQVLLLRLLSKLFPGLRQRFVRTVTIPRTQTFASMPADGTKSVSYITFDAVVGRNSKFHLLTEENLEELGGVEYRALTALLWIVGGYHILTQLISFTVIAPYISTRRWRSDFEVPNLHRYVPPVWFSAFQVVSAYTNAGMSLVDQSMIPFQRAYPMILFMAFLVLAGNTAFPIFLRFTIWVITKLVPPKSRANETLHFLLDHPRRCFFYLFPAHQTWFLLTVVVMLTATDWFFFLVLDIGNDTIEQIPIGVRFIIGFLQATAVRAAGFATVSISTLAPGVQVLYVMMMYVSVYPIAMSVRSTNVYEEKSLGVFEEEEDQDEPSGEGPRAVVWGQYLAWHARRQLAFDMWWLGLALFLVCIIERTKIQDQANFQFFTIFNIIFELISAYGGVGLSLGVPFANYSFSGAFTPLSKLIVCAVMIRGRHRGLPVAIDRAVMLPSEFMKKKEGENEDNDDNATEEQRYPTNDGLGLYKRTKTKAQGEISEKNPAINQ